MVYLFHGWKSLVGCSLWGCSKSKRLSNFTFTFHFHALEKDMATHSSVLALRIPGTGEPGGLPSMGSHRVGHDWSDLAAAAAYKRVLSEKWKWSRSVMSDSLRPHGHQAPPSMGFSRQEYWSGLPFPSPGNFPTHGSNPGLPHCRQTLYHLSHQGSLQYPLSNHYFFPPPLCPWQLPIYFLTLYFPILDIWYKWNHSICDFLCLA